MAGLRELKVLILGDATGAEAAFGKMKTSSADLDKKLEGTTGKMEGLAKGGLGAVTSFAGLAAGGAAVAWIDQGITKFANLGTQVAQFERVTGASAQQASTWIAVGQNLGITTDDLTRSMGMLASNVQLHTDKLAKWGVEIAHNKDGTVDLTGTMDSLKGRFQATTDATQRDAMAKDLLGKSYQSLLPYLTDTKTHIDEITAAAAKRGDILSQKDVTQAVDYKRSMEELKSSVDGFQRELGQALIPQLLSTVKELTGVLNTVDSLTKHFGGLSSVFKAANAVLNPLDFAYHGITKSLDGLTGSHKKAAVTVSGDFVGAMGLGIISSMTMQQQTDATTAAQQALTDQMKASATAEAAWSKQWFGDFDTLTSVGGPALAGIVSGMDLTLPELDAMTKHAQQMQSSMTSSFTSATDVVSAFGSQTKVTGKDIETFFYTQVVAAQNWERNLRTLMAQGVNSDIVDQFAQAGPKAAVALQGMVDEVTVKGSGAINAADVASRTILTNAVTAVTTYDAKFQAAGQGLIDGMTAGVVERQQGLINAVTGVTNTALLRAKQANGIASPSRVWAEQVGKPLAEGVVAGFSSHLSSTPLTVPFPGRGGVHVGGSPAAGAGGAVINATIATQMSGQDIVRKLKDYARVNGWGWIDH